MENNKLIAEFMGVKYPMLKGSDLQYHTSWDWLMPVIRKIEDGGLDPHELIDKALESRVIEDTYNEVVDTIKRYNNDTTRKN